MIGHFTAIQPAAIDPGFTKLQSAAHPKIYTPSIILPRSAEDTALALWIGRHAEGAFIRMRSANRLKGRLCNQTVPWPRNVARKQPLSAKEHALQALLRPGCRTPRWRRKATMHPVSTRSVSPSKLPLDHGATGVEESPSIALKFLQNKTLSSKKSSAQLAVKGNAH